MKTEAPTNKNRLRHYHFRSFEDEKMFHVEHIAFCILDKIVLLIEHLFSHF